MHKLWQYTGVLSLVDDLPNQLSYVKNCKKLALDGCVITDSLKGVN